MGQFFTALFSKIAAVVEWFGKLFVSIFVALWDLVRDAFCWPFDQVTDIAVSAVSSVDLTGLSEHVGAWSTLPAEIINILGLLGVGTAASIIVAAIIIRIGLQLIPFVRLGS
ncbi:DUF2523 family protein [Paracidovorax citrulli]|uniref:DUF2523 domain-containing protein n=2 Tax=Paracidovorax citrulli TaxID=80869 RepID=A1TPU0_PARC0|nr:DUF2523 family protein [Paracidovorax citrulli]ABM32978.1 hypothetical protein Aave_2403 [Paracidovorax citrulli AAC00-1]ATG93059.1 DUF2523 domain-containing protein [Paracidovorax citrulli]MVT29075.1 DUF2523 domain-containing protein [Paracidovorax citrulli]MVT36636.1 DUF2523 domain-containing protein [Paracidovorax citrulli]REG68639.1 uncharacterized protein DUF2523 [Paracidovorax citrulli]